MGSEKSDNGVSRDGLSSYFGRLSEENTSQNTRRRIVGQEDVRERKKWERPPLVGAPNSLHQSSDSEPDTPTPSAYFSSRTDFISGKPPSEPSLDADTRGPSPSSMSNSSVRPLEWDSSADVGCVPYPVNPKLSTLEKLALERGCSSLLTRSDPEGTTSNVRVAGAPTATSTPVTVRVEKSDEEKNYYPLFPEVVVLHHTQESSSDVEKSPLGANGGSRDVSNVKPPQKLGKKLSSSLENMREKNKQDDFVPATFPRSFSQNNVSSEGIKLPHKSNSSSSVATVVTKKNSTGSSKYRPQRDFNTLESCGMSSEDRAHSFEYLPGHIYENTVQSNPEAEDKLWTSGDNTLKRDVERGVSLLAEFVRGSKMNDKALKKELLRRVVEKLIRSEYLEDEKVDDEEEKKSIPEERRAEVSGESTGVSNSAQSFSSHQESEPTSNKNQIGTRPSTSLSGQSASSEWNSYSVESGSGECISSESLKDSKESKIKPVRRPTRPRAFPPSVPKLTTKKEEIFKHLKEEGESTERQLIGFLNSERENQLLWIQREISHLTSLKTLLEKHEVLKKKLGNLKKSKASSNERGKRRILSEVEESKGRFTWRRQTLAETFQQNRNMECRERNTSCSLDSVKENGWSSHHYYETDTERVVRKGKKDAFTETNTSIGVQTSTLRQHPKSVAYSIIFDEKQPRKEEVSRTTKLQGRRDMISVDELQGAINEILGRRERVIEGRSDETKAPTSNRPALQDYLKKNRPTYVQRAEERQKILSEIAEYREAREKQKTKILAASVVPEGAQDLDLPPHPLARRRITSQKNMRRMTEKKYRTTAEVLNRKTELKKKQAYRTNKLMAEIFNKNLQKKTLRGEVNLSNSVSVLAH